MNKKSSARVSKSYDKHGRSGSARQRCTRLVSSRCLRGDGGIRLPPGLGRRHLDWSDQLGHNRGKHSAISRRKTSRILGTGFVSLGELARFAAGNLAGHDAAVQRDVRTAVRPAGFFSAQPPALLGPPGHYRRAITIRPISKERWSDWSISTASTHSRLGSASGPQRRGRERPDRQLRLFRQRSANHPAGACHGERRITARQMPGAISTSLRGTDEYPFL